LIKLIKSDQKTFIISQKISFFSFNKGSLKTVLEFPQKNIKQHNCFQH